VVLSLATVFGIRATVDGGATGGLATLAVADGRGATAANDGHQHEHDNGSATAAHAHASADSDDHAHSADDSHDAADHEHEATGGNQSHDSGAHEHSATGTAGGSHAGTATHDHSSTSPGTSTGTHDDGHDHSASGGTGTTPTTTHQHSTTPPTGGSTTPTTTHNHPPASSDPVQLGALPADVRAQVIAVRDWAMQFPTTQDAVNNAYPQATIFFHGIAAHYLNYSILDGAFDPAEPEALLYGEQGQLVGVNYIVYSGSTPPEGFAGDFDHWHEHPTLCRNHDTGIVVGEALSEADCAALGGSIFYFSGFWLLHVWCIPGWESPEGIFSHENSRV
jgi:hypothetical protein